MAKAVAALVQNGRAWLVRILVAEVYTIGETARILGTAAPMVYGYINRGKLPAYLIDGVKHVKHADLISFITSRRQLRRSLDARIKPQRVVPHKKGDPSVRKDFDVPLDYVE